MHQSLFTFDPRAARWHTRATRRALGWRRDQRGLTLLEIMIVLAILALIMGLVVGPMVMRQYGDARRRIAAAAVDKYVNEAYPMWAMANPDKSCPASFEELRQHGGTKGDRDPWGQPYRLLCGASLPPGAVNLAVASNGPDQKEGTDDDVKSW